ncbi:SF1B family DNA helicase RecD2 [Candidatus Berkiella aquae]|uniref:ATP-dependent RecD2 DNA helicase n=1 Tax=Candidatus Berkiella aquae TaxID=295108 RepID=A0A0Q9YMR0_9GAMM|nr:ATP-dependent RecD-like DNA helicase [Candidatus Berkiella aquae]MCS5712737.1 ATP-dependent RecD-like DNA helicase [Candidatus Berkiella aquae]
MNQSSKESLKLLGKVTKIVFNRPDNGYTVMQVERQDTHKNKVTVVGYFQAVMLGERVHFEGIWQEHPTHGQQFFAKSFTKEQENTTEEKFFIHHIDGVGPSFAQKLQQTFGDDLKEILNKSPQRLKEVSGIGQERYKRIMESWGKHQASHDTLLFLTNCEIGFSTANKIYKHYAEHTLEKISSNPYRLLDEIEGVGFHTAELLAKHLQIANDDPRRLRAGLMHVMQQETRFGHCGMAYEKCLTQTANLLKIAKAELVNEVDFLVNEKKLMPETLKEQLCLFMPTLWLQEQLISQKIKNLLAGKGSEDTQDLILTLKELEKSLTLSQEQYHALEQALQSPVFVLTGGPGVGKTTSVNTLVEIFKINHLKIALAAPTGRAAKRLQEATKSPAKTIHRLLEFDSFTEKFNFGKYHPLPIDVLIVDEASMLDVPLCAQLLEALPAHARLIFVGDVDQLSSVGPGEVLRSLIVSGQVPYFALKTIFRQEHTSQIVINAHRVNQGMLPDINNEAGVDFYQVKANEPADFLRKIAIIVGERLPARFSFSSEEIQVISPMNIGPLGVNNLNKILQETLNPGTAHKAKIKQYDGFLREGDKVIQVVNNYEKNVFNGDIGKIISIDEEHAKVKVEFEQHNIIEYLAKELDQLQLAYAITVHKSQGSEYPAVVVVLSMAQKTMLKRNLLYTAITRGKKCVVLLCEEQALRLAVNTHEVATRINKLEEWLHEY